MASQEVPTQVRIRCDEHPNRYETIQQAKEALGKGNNTATILAACEHAWMDKSAKREALAWAARELSGAQAEELADLLSTRHLGLDVETEISVSPD